MGRLVRRGAEIAQLNRCWMQMWRVGQGVSNGLHGVDGGLVAPEPLDSMRKPLTQACSNGNNDEDGEDEVDDG